MIEVVTVKNHRPMSPRDRHVIARTIHWVRDAGGDFSSGWLVYASNVPGDRRVEVRFAAVRFIRARSSRPGRQSEREWFDQGWDRSGKFSFEFGHVPAVSSVVIEDAKNEERISLADMIAFERMWPTFVKLLSVSGDLHEERKVTL